MTTALLDEEPSGNTSNISYSACISLGFPAPVRGAYRFRLFGSMGHKLYQFPLSVNTGRPYVALGRVCRLEDGLSFARSEKSQRGVPERGELSGCRARLNGKKWNKSFHAAQ